MKVFLNLIKNFFTGYFSIIASAASIIGLVIVFIPDKNQIILALLAFVLFLLIILFRLFFITKTFILQKTGSGEHKFATYVSWTDVDSKHICFELQKYVQCKTFIITEHVHNFHWTGTKSPIISSDQQEFIRHEKSENGDDFDKAILKFKKALTYNDFAIIQIKMDIDNSDGKAKKYCGHRVEENLQLISFRIELRYLESATDAKLIRKKLNTTIDKEEEQLGFVAFDNITRCYSHGIYNPEVGYSYAIKWD